VHRLTSVFVGHGLNLDVAPAHLCKQITFVEPDSSPAFESNEVCKKNMISVKTGKMFESGKKYSMELLISLYPDYCKMVYSLETPSLVLINGCEGKREWLCDTTKVTQSETSKGGLSLGMNGYGPGCESRLWHMKAIVPTSLRFSTFVRKVLKGELSIQDDFADF